jgi:hypothetical protein
MRFEKRSGTGASCSPTLPQCTCEPTLLTSAFMRIIGVLDNSSVSKGPITLITDPPVSAELFSALQAKWPNDPDFGQIVLGLGTAGKGGQILVLSDPPPTTAFIEALGRYLSDTEAMLASVPLLQAELGAMSPADLHSKLESLSGGWGVPLISPAPQQSFTCSTDYMAAAAGSPTCTSFGGQLVFDFSAQNVGGGKLTATIADISGNFEWNLTSGSYSPGPPGGFDTSRVMNTDGIPILLNLVWRRLTPASRMELELLTGTLSAEDKTYLFNKDAESQWIWLAANNS